VARGSPTTWGRRVEEKLLKRAMEVKDTYLLLPWPRLRRRHEDAP
jgi:hypothetical protein